MYTFPLVPGRQVYLDVDEHHDAGGEVEATHHGVHHVPGVLT